MATELTPEDAARRLVAGEVVVIPTDTVYGLAARPDLPLAVSAIFALKGRPGDKPLPILGGSVSQLESVAVFDGGARLLAETFWPGGLTIVLPRAPGFDHDLGGTGSTVAVRVPDSELALRVLGMTGPLAVTSANVSGRPPAATGEEARAYFEDVPLLEGGTAGGRASTTISLIGGLTVLREGEVTEEALRQSLMS
jgi:L-threonylcarbamoyladenylate synthase